MKEFLNCMMNNIFNDKKICIHTYAQAKKSGKLDEKIKEISNFRSKIIQKTTKK